MYTYRMRSYNMIPGLRVPGMRRRQLVFCDHSLVWYDTHHRYDMIRVRRTYYIPVTWYMRTYVLGVIIWCGVLECGVRRRSGTATTTTTIFFYVDVLFVVSQFFSVSSCFIQVSSRFFVHGGEQKRASRLSFPHIGRTDRWVIITEYVWYLQCNVNENKAKKRGNRLIKKAWERNDV